MTLFRNKYRVESARLKNWDYASEGYYFITICTQNRECCLGDIDNGKMGLSEIGGIAEKCWSEIPAHFPHVELDAFIVMPNHIHGIVVINDIADTVGGAGGDGGPAIETQNFASLQRPRRPPHHRDPSPNHFGPQSKNLASIIRGYKIGVKKWATTNKFTFAWQPRFHDHIIRNQQSLSRIRKYIIENPLKWERDRNNAFDLYM
jgi:hypothetical protein